MYIPEPSVVSPSCNHDQRHSQVIQEQQLDTSVNLLSCSRDLPKASQWPAGTISIPASQKRKRTPSHSSDDTSPTGQQPIVLPLTHLLAKGLLFAHLHPEVYSRFVHSS